MASGSGAPPGSRYVDLRHFAVAAALSDLRGPERGVVTLDRRLDWSGDSTYDLDDAGRRTTSSRARCPPSTRAPNPETS